MGPPKRRSKATWGRYPDLSKGDVSFFNAQKASRAIKPCLILKRRFQFWETKLKKKVRNDCNLLVCEIFSRIQNLFSQKNVLFSAKFFFVKISSFSSIEKLYLDCKEKDHKKIGLRKDVSSRGSLSQRRRGETRVGNPS